MIRKTAAFAAVLAVVMAPSVRPVRSQSRSSNAAVLCEGARLIPGDGSQPFTSGAMLVENGVITKVGVKGVVSAPRAALRVDLTGKTIMPSLINANRHAGFQPGRTYRTEN